MGSQCEKRMSITDQEAREWLDAGRQLTRSERSVALAYIMQVIKSRPKKPRLSLVVLNAGSSS